MSVISVRDAIKKAVAFRDSDGCRGPRVTTREARAVIREAQKNGVTE